MSMIKFALLGLVLSLIRASSEWQLTKCCPPGQIYVNSFTNCKSVPLFAIDVYSHYWNITRELQGIPQCDESEDLVAMPLDDFESNTILELLHTRKCCSGDTIFDSRTKTCLTRLNETQSLGAFLLNRSSDAESAVILTHGPPKCQGPIVNYEINENDIFLRNNTYSVMIPVSKNNVKEEPVTEDNACLEMTPEFAVKRRLIVRICRDMEFCDTNACIRKCCPEDEYIYEGCTLGTFSVPNEPGEFYNAFAYTVNQTNSFTFDTTKDYGVLIVYPCEKLYGLNDPNEWESNVLLTSNGHVVIRNDDDANNMHCFDVIRNSFDNSSSFALFVCSKYIRLDTYRSTDWWFAILIVKCLFFLMTLLVYAYLPNLQNIHGKTVICYVSTILLSTIFKFIIDWFDKVAAEQQEKKSCKAIAYIGYFFFRSTEFWLNVMCFDIWWTFRTLREKRIIKDRNNRKRFLLYCLYAWGISFLMSIFIIVADNTDILTDYLELNIGDLSCDLVYTVNWDNYSDFIFIYGPETIVTISNVVFFILTTKYYNKVKADIKNVITDPRSKQLCSNRKRFIMNFKLFIVMGMQWMFYVVDYFHEKYLGYNRPWKIFFYISVVFYCLEGLLIFIIFVLKKSVYQAISKRIRNCKI
ncbi:G-protein coupled receptor Mth2 isoform X2 [Solenopsis invicta]|uniref:G-protein coupled receptor Mth2 isoform X2 n=1 Tax=Solenopsis invicta TaxID=13686 RepID=UPI00193D712D|nr:G-protein coupled receptor Mth2 isoform X2 [Solenopsis invicta]